MVRKSSYSNINRWSVLHVFTILFCCALVMSIMTLIPRHNSILDQSYWFEINIVTATSYFIMTVVIVLDFIILFEKGSFVTIQFFLKNYLATFLTWIACFCVSYMIWTLILEYNHPMPMYGFYLHFPTKIVSAVSLPLMLPLEFSLEKQTKQRLKNFSWLQLSWQLTNIFKLLIGAIFKKLGNTDAQCVFALLIPIAKRSTIFLLSKLMNRITGSDNERANFNLAAHINFTYGLFSAIHLVGGRTATIVCVASVDALMQLIMTYQIVKLHKKVAVDENETSKMQKQKAILKLVLAELCESLVPLAYAITFAMAYYGPNAELFGNVKNGYWQFKINEDVSRTFVVMFGLFLIDLVFLAMNSSIIWMFCKVNLLDEFCSVMQKYWYILALKIVNDLWWHFVSRDVNMAGDLTGKYCWITNDKNISLSSNCTDV